MKENPKTCQKDTPNKLKPDAKKHRSDGWLETVFLRAVTIEGGGVAALLDNLIE